MTKKEKLPLPIRPDLLYHPKMMLSVARWRCVLVQSVLYRISVSALSH